MSLKEAKKTRHPLLSCYWVVFSWLHKGCTMPGVSFSNSLFPHMANQSNTTKKIRHSNLWYMISSLLYISH